MNEPWMKEFKNPGAAYRGKPFWAWNGKLEPEELRRQIRIMRDMGLGGFFMHSRVGLATPYLAREWFESVDACVDEAKKLGMEAWMYDEDRWPSGAAGGLVTRNPKHRMRSLAAKPLAKSERLKWTSDTVAAFVARIEKDTAHSVRPIPRGQKAPDLADGESVVTFQVQIQSCSDWYNGYTYLDTLSHSAVKAFIKATHEAYLRRNGGEFGKTIPGMFTDEPNHGNILHHDNNTGCPGGLPWTGALLATFKRRYGYDLVPHLMELVYDVDGNGVTPARYHYHDCITHLYVDAFCRQVGEWCAKRKILFTGHQLEEDSLSSQTNMVGSCMRTYEHMQAPGMDLLTERWFVFNTAKQVSSAAHQFGWKWRLTETYGCTGWDFPFLGHKALGDWQVAMGINLRSQHLAWYTMEGEAKRDYPAGIFYQSPWWELYPKVEDGYARIHAVMTRGAEVRDLLVIHPVESMWMMVKADWRANPATDAYDRQFAQLSFELLAAHLDFDFGDEELLSRHARVAKTAQGPTLRVGKAVYKSVLVPPLKTMRRSTLDLLGKFKAAGGQVVFVGEPAAHVEAVPSNDVAQFAARCERVADVGPEVAGPPSAKCRRVSICDASGKEVGPALYLLREDRDAFYLFVCNTGEDFARSGRRQMNQPMARDRKLAFEDVRIRGFAGCDGHPVELDPETGASAAAEAVRSGDGWEILTRLDALGSRLFVVPKRKAAAVPKSAPRLVPVRVVGLGADRWDIALSECSNLVLDRPRFKIGDGDWRNAEEILRVDCVVREALGVRPRRGGMVQPWARERKKNPPHVAVTLAYDFLCKARISGDLFVALEQPATFRVRLNGAPISVDAECGWWVDRSLRKLPVDPTLLRIGVNELTLDCDYTEEHPGLEIAYLLGSFGSEVDGTSVSMTALPTSLTLGDWVPQGLAFYSGSVAYRKTVAVEANDGERLYVRVPEYRGVAFRVLVNGRVAGVSGWAPHEVEITDFVGRDPVELQIQVIGHRRNSHGPFHINDKWPAWTGPGEYACRGDRWFDGYQLVPCGIMSEPLLVAKGRA
jgi:hypothetical protein